VDSCSFGRSRTSATRQTQSSIVETSVVWVLGKGRHLTDP
jgi:hypothetical protein